jgi:hypothetical protein
MEKICSIKDFSLLEIFFSLPSNNSSLESKMFYTACILLVSFTFLIGLANKEKIYEFRLVLRNKNFFSQYMALVIGYIFAHGIVSQLVAHNCQSVQFLSNHIFLQRIPIFIALAFIARSLYIIFTPAIFSTNNYKNYYYALSWVLARTFDSDIKQISEEVDRSKKQLLELCQDLKQGGDELKDQDQVRIYAKKVMELINAEVNKVNNTTYAQN